MSVHDTARRGFAGAAEAYEEGRPTYPDEALRWLATELRLGPGRTVVALDAGTGKLTRLLLATEATVIALTRTTSGARVRAGTAERTGLPDAAADAVTVAHAFHWLDGPEGLAEIHRVLGPGGKVAVIYNVRDLDDPVQHAVDDLLAPYRGDTPSHRSGRWRTALNETELFKPAAQRDFPNIQTVDADDVVSRVASTSFIAELPDPERRRVFNRARDIAADQPDRFPFPYTTEIELFDRH